MKYVAYDNFDNFYVGILGICENEADAQELILAATEEEAYNAFLDNYYYDDAEITMKPGEDPLARYIKDKTPEVENYNKYRLADEFNISLYGLALIEAGEYYTYSIGKEY